MQTWADYLDQLKHEKALANPAWRPPGMQRGSAHWEKRVGRGLGKHVPQVRAGFKDTVARPIKISSSTHPTALPPSLTGGGNCPVLICR